ncbi:hypothetical protein [Sphingobacterium lactis]
MKNYFKMIYKTPQLKREDIFLENGIAADSAVYDPSTSTDVQHEWETETDDNRDYEWDW